MLDWFESDTRKQRDIKTLRSLYMRYGDEAEPILQHRAADKTLDKRSKKHWRRLFRKARKYGPLSQL